MYCRMPYLPGLPHPVDKYCSTPEARRLWLRGERQMLERGEAYRNPDMAESLRAIARNGAAELYTGALAETIVEDFERNGAFVTRDDLAGYRERWSRRSRAPTAASASRARTCPRAGSSCSRC